jgi:hypothetical protein
MATLDESFSFTGNRQLATGHYLVPTDILFEDEVRNLGG